jgi:hypothetical protein
LYTVTVGILVNPTPIAITATPATGFSVLEIKLQAYKQLE